MKKSRPQLSRHFPEKPFRAPKIIFKSIPLAGGVVIWAPSERQQIKVQIFERANLSDFGMWKFIAKEDLNQQKQVFLFNFRHWPAQKPKIWSIFYGKKFTYENYVV